MTGIATFTEICQESSGAPSGRVVRQRRPVPELHREGL